MDREEVALQHLDVENLEIFRKGIEAYSKALANNDREIIEKIEPLIISNFYELLEYLPYIRNGYYDEKMFQILRECLIHLYQIRDLVKNQEVKDIVEESIKEIQSFFKRFGKEYPTYYRKYQYPYKTEMDKALHYEEIWSKVLSDAINKAKRYDEEALKEYAKNQLIGDLIAHDYLGKEYTSVERMKELAKRRQNLFLDACNRVKQELDNSSKWIQNLEHYEKLSQDVEEREKQLEKARKKMLELATEYVLESSKEE